MPDQVLVRLRDTLPAPGNIGDLAEIEEQARAVVSLILDRTSKDFPFEQIESDPRSCPNCDGPVASIRSPYCGDACREMSAFVRQFRNSAKEGLIFDRERQIAMGQTLWYVLGGGRPLRQEIAPGAVRKQLMKREDGKCQVCGAPATTFDHIGSG